MGLSRRRSPPSGRGGKWWVSPRSSTGSTHPAFCAGKMRFMRAVVPVERDLRLDLFRGLALWLLFLDQLPSAVVSAFAIRSYGFSDATEIIVFVFGYTAGFVYGPLMRARGFVVATANILRRAWQVYVAHVFLFVFYIAEIAYVSRPFGNPLFAEGTTIFEFLHRPAMPLFQGLIPNFNPFPTHFLPLYT